MQVFIAISLKKIFLVTKIFLFWMGMWYNIIINPHSFLVLRVSPWVCEYFQTLFLNSFLMKIIINEATGLRELVINAVLKAVGTEIRTTKPTEKHPEGAKFRWCEVAVTYPNGSVKTVDSTIWDKSLTSLPDAFEVGKEISLTTQLEGDGAGYSKVGLPTLRRVDLTAFDLSTVEAPEMVSEDLQVEA